MRRVCGSLPKVEKRLLGCIEEVAEREVGADNSDAMLGAGNRKRIGFDTPKTLGPVCTKYPVESATARQPERLAEPVMVTGHEEYRVWNSGKIGHGCRCRKTGVTLNHPGVDAIMRQSASLTREQDIKRKIQVIARAGVCDVAGDKNEVELTLVDMDEVDEGTELGIAMPLHVRWIKARVRAVRVEKMQIGNVQKR